MAPTSAAYDAQAWQPGRAMAAYVKRPMIIYIDSQIIPIACVSNVAQDSRFMWKMHLSIIIKILRDNSSTTLQSRNVSGVPWHVNSKWRILYFFKIFLWIITFTPWLYHILIKIKFVNLCSLSYSFSTFFWCCLIVNFQLILHSLAHFEMLQMLNFIIFVLFLFRNIYANKSFWALLTKFLDENYYQR